MPSGGGRAPSDEASLPDGGVPPGGPPLPIGGGPLGGPDVSLDAVLVLLAPRMPFPPPRPWCWPLPAAGSLAATGRAGGLVMNFQLSLIAPAWGPSSICAWWVNTLLVTGWLAGAGAGIGALVCATAIEVAAVNTRPSVTGRLREEETRTDLGIEATRGRNGIPTILAAAGSRIVTAFLPAITPIGRRPGARRALSGGVG